MVEFGAKCPTIMSENQGPQGKNAWLKDEIDAVETQFIALCSEIERVHGKNVPSRVEEALGILGKNIERLKTAREAP